MNDGRGILIALLVIIALPLLWGSAMMTSGGGMMGGWGSESRWEPWRMIMGFIPMIVMLGGLANWTAEAGRALAF